VRLAYVELCGFRGYRKRLRLDLASEFTIIDGRNGVGKSTIFDAVEYALTGHLSKYPGARADGETIADYLWWKGSGELPEDRYVEVGFIDAEHAFSVRRSEFRGPDDAEIQRMTGRLCDVQNSPTNPIVQVCSSTVIRDEHIAALTLDLKETERYALLRDGLGANDSEHWISRAAQLVSSAKKRMQAAQQAVIQQNSELMAATRRIDELRSKIVADSVLAEAVEQLRQFASSTAPVDELIGPSREAIARAVAGIEATQELANLADAALVAREALPNFQSAHLAARQEADAAADALRILESQTANVPSSEALAQHARDLVALVELGRRIGLHNGHCPLCHSEHRLDTFQRGTTLAEELAMALDQRAAAEARQAQASKLAAARFQAAVSSLDEAEGIVSMTLGLIERFDALCLERGWPKMVTSADLLAESEQTRARVAQAQRAMRVVETVQLNTELDQAKRDEERAMEKLRSVEERAGRARKAEVTAQALHDAARRAAGETLDRRLDRVLPLMSELYRRLRPHPVWRDIEYSIRGDVRKFLKLQVGDDLNPQFLFSSGQRRATGLAFLLAVNLSLAWSRWRTIMLDDPVQHVDDFRTVHLAELTAQLVAEGRQIVCAVEDSALAELFCRRLPVRNANSAKHVTLGSSRDGDLGIVTERYLPPLPARVLLGQRAEAS
jgi:chromosome segregation protein